ncbi:hypothetical protein JB92DRAFT_2824287 [Gautieria morchelliformis]|nr:hypothetical protein JB92DRAFT_2824287 [Gautieria morchelliformis]
MADQESQQSPEEARSAGRELDVFPWVTGRPGDVEMAGQIVSGKWQASGEMPANQGSTMTDKVFTQSNSLGLCLHWLELIDCEDITGNTLIAYIEVRQVSGHVEDFQLLVSGCPGVEDKHLGEVSHFVIVEGVDDYP